jgi:hypothetical protein
MHPDNVGASASASASANAAPTPTPRAYRHPTGLFANPVSLMGDGVPYFVVVHPDNVVAIVSVRGQLKHMPEGAYERMNAATNTVDGSWIEFDPDNADDWALVLTDDKAGLKQTHFDMLDPRDQDNMVSVFGEEARNQPPVYPIRPFDGSVDANSLPALAEAAGWEVTVIPTCGLKLVDERSNTTGESSVLGLIAGAASGPDTLPDNDIVGAAYGGDDNLSGDVVDEPVTGNGKIAKPGVRYFVHRDGLFVSSEGHEPYVLGVHGDHSHEVTIGGIDIERLESLSLTDALAYVDIGAWVEFDPDNESDWAGVLQRASLEEMKSNPQPVFLKTVDGPVAVDLDKVHTWFKNLAFARAATRLIESVGADLIDKLRNDMKTETDPHRIASGQILAAIGDALIAGSPLRSDDGMLGEGSGTPGVKVDDIPNVIPTWNGTDKPVFGVRAAGGKLFDSLDNEYGDNWGGHWIGVYANGAVMMHFERHESNSMYEKARDVRDLPAARALDQFLFSTIQFVNLGESELFDPATDKTIDPDSIEDLMQEIDAKTGAITVRLVVREEQPA